jgi:hypothetical protein
MIPTKIECESCGFTGSTETDENTDHLMNMGCRNAEPHVPHFCTPFV